MERGFKSETISKGSLISIKPPPKLLELQNWFAKLILQPLQPDHQIPKNSPFSTPIEKETKKFIAPSHSLEPFQRIEIYHQQYWWRLVNCLNKNFPMLTHLFGYETFKNKIAVPYLAENPPSHWALCRLGASLPTWIEKSYHDDDKGLISNASQIDWATNVAFWMKQKKPVNFAKLSPEAILDKKLTLQPYLTLFHLKGNLFQLREELLKKEVSYWMDHPFPEMSYGNFYFVLYRSPKQEVKWKELSLGEYQMLSHFKMKATIQEACQKIEEGASEETTHFLAFWFREWTYLKWFCEA